MNVVEKESHNFYRTFYSIVNRNGLESSKDMLTTKLYNFNRDRDKLDFLKILRSKSLVGKEAHMKTCQGCDYEEAVDTGVFAIDDEIDEINRFYTFEAKDKNKFSVEEETNLHTKLNKIIEELELRGYAQQIIFDEIEELKSHFNLGKKNWLQLFKGKLSDLISKKILDKTIVTGVYNMLSDGFEETIKMID